MAPRTNNNPAIRLQGGLEPQDPPRAVLPRRALRARARHPPCACIRWGSVAERLHVSNHRYG